MKGCQATVILSYLITLRVRSAEGQQLAKAGLCSMSEASARNNEELQVIQSGTGIT